MSDKDINKKSNRGGHREGAGRKPGSKNKIDKATVQTVIDMLYDKSGQVYEEILIEDFLKARQSNDALTLKYHTLLAGKLMPDLQAVEINNPQDSVEAKAQAFADAIAALTKANKNN